LRHISCTSQCLADFSDICDVVLGSNHTAYRCVSVVSLTDIIPTYTPNLVQTVDGWTALRLPLLGRLGWIKTNTRLKLVTRHRRTAVENVPTVNGRWTHAVQKSPLSELTVQHNEPNSSHRVNKCNTTEKITTFIHPLSTSMLQLIWL